MLRLRFVSNENENFSKFDKEVNRKYHKLIYFGKKLWGNTKRKEKDLLNIDGYNSNMKFEKSISEMWRKKTSRNLSV